MIVVAGYYGFRNAGDEAIAAAIAAELRRRGEGALLLSADPPHTAGLGVRALPRMQPIGLARALLRGRALWLGGGGLLQDRTSRKSLLYYLGLLYAARALGKRVVVFNQSVGPLSPWGRAQVARALQKGGKQGAVTCIVRDQGSAALLGELGIPARLGGDPALLLAPPPVQRNRAQVLLAPRGDQPQATAALHELADTLRAQGYTVRAAALYPDEDRQAALSLDPQAETSGDPAEVLRLIAASGFVVGVRLHAPILAAAAGVPFLGVAYDPKVSGFCADAGAPHFPTSVGRAELLEALGKQPDWNAVADMKARARESFTWALEAK